MYNVCNSCGGGYVGVNTARTDGYWNIFGNGQRVCRDCQGVIHVHNYGCCNRCRCNCGNTNNNTETGNTTNGNGYGCITVCGNAANATSTTATANTTAAYDEYYARQYALNGRSNRAACRCGYYGW